VTTGRSASRPGSALLLIAALALVSACTGNTAGSAVRSQDATSTSTALVGSSNTQPVLTIHTVEIEHLDRVSISGSGFKPKSDIVVAQCSDDAALGSDMQDTCDMSDFGPAHADEKGSFEARVVVTTVLGIGQRIESDCLSTQCAIGAGYVDNLILGSSVPIEWSSSAKIEPAPVLSIQRLSLDGDTKSGSAQVSGVGFAPASTVSLVQCPIARDGAGVDAEDCLYDYGTVVTADSSGKISVTLAVYPRFQRSSGALIDCVATPELCVIADPWPKARATRMSWVTFRSAAG
jgi:hypothetical protein